MNILLFTGREFRSDGNLNLHLNHLKYFAKNIDLLSNNKTGEDKKLLRDELKLNVKSSITWFVDWYFKNFKLHNNWISIYDNLDVSHLKQYDLFYVAGGLFATNLGINNRGKLKNKFPEGLNKGFFSNPSKYINGLAILKAHHTYNIPIHELAFDPDELSMAGWHKSIKANHGENYYLYHGYTDERHNLLRLDSNLHYIRNNPVVIPNKEYDLVFGYTMFRNNKRSIYIDRFTELSKNVENKVIFENNFGRDRSKNNFKRRSEYLSYIAKSRFTYILPSFCDEFFSIYRLEESLQYDCLPIISKDCYTEEVNKTFGINLDVLKLDELPNEDFRQEQLSILKKSILDSELQMLRNVNYSDNIIDII